MHCRATFVDAPPTQYILFGLSEKFVSHFWIALQQHRIACFLISVVFQRDARRLGIQLKWILTLLSQTGIPSQQGQVRGQDRGLLLVQPTNHVIAVRDAVTVGNDERWSVERFGFAEGSYSL